jgi:predicted transcriptional regulator
MKNINNKKSINPMEEIKKSKNFHKYLEDANNKIRLSQEIYQTRKGLGITQQKLAKMTGATQKMISYIESGDVNTGFDLLNRIAKSLNFNYENWSRIYNFTIPLTIIFESSTIKLKTKNTKTTVTNQTVNF